MALWPNEKTTPATFATKHASLFREPLALTQGLTRAFAEKCLRVPKSKQGKSGRRIRSGDLSKANADWARVAEMEEPHLRNRGQEKNRRAQKFFAFFCWLQGGRNRRAVSGRVNPLVRRSTVH